MSEIIVNPFDDTGFDLATMTDAINLIPNKYGRVREMGIFTPDPVTNRKVVVDEVNGVLTLLKSQPVGAPPVKAKHEKAKTRLFLVPHIPYEDRILPEDFQDVRQWGTGQQVSTLDKIMLTRLVSMRGSHAITEEYLMVGALKGKILDADGSTIYNLFTEFGVSEKTVAFALGVATTDVSAKCRAVIRHIEDNLLGDVMTGVHCHCDETYFDAFIGHDNVEKFYLNHARTIELSGNGQDPRKGFSFGGITFEEYRGKATDPTTGNSRVFMAAGEARFFPIGTQNTFKIHHAPANLLETVNTPGMPMYARQTLDPKGRFVDIYTESNPLPLCRRPKLLVKGTL